MRRECHLLIRGSFDELAVGELGAGADEGDEVGCVDGGPVGLGGFDELNAMDAAALEPGPLVARWRRRMVAKVDSIGLVVRRWIQCSAGSRRTPARRRGRRCPWRRPWSTWCRSQQRTPSLQ